jgi:imidazolonepropionase
MRTIIENIKGLVQAGDDICQAKRGQQLAYLHVIPDAYLIIEDEYISDYGQGTPSSAEGFDRVINANGKFVFPSFVDSHTHIVFAGNREMEFVEKIKGATYAEIAAKGGGILASSEMIRKTSEDELYRQSMRRVDEVISQGTGALEIKSGYGLDTELELKMLRVIRRIRDSCPMPIKSTFLGAHAVPKNISKQKYLDQVIHEMIPRVAEEKLADYCDVFCESGFFSPEESVRVLEKALEYGLKPKVHANQLNNSGGVQVGVETGAVSVDHLESIGEEETDLLGRSDIISTTLPGAAFFLRSAYPPARKLIEKNAALCIASDYNPGSSPTGNIQLMIALACIQMRMEPSEAINAATINGACAMEVQDKAGSISRGKLANLFITKEIPSIEFMPYAFGSSLIEQVMLRGKIISDQ